MRAPARVEHRVLSSVRPEAGEQVSRREADQFNRKGIREPCWDFFGEFCDPNCHPRISCSFSCRKLGA